MQGGQPVDAASGIVAVSLGALGWFFHDAPIALFGIPVSAVALAYSGVMLANFVLGPPVNRKRAAWMVSALFTLGACATDRLMLARWSPGKPDHTLLVGMAFALGVGYPFLSWSLTKGGLISAIRSRIRGNQR